MSTVYILEPSTESAEAVLQQQKAAHFASNCDVPTLLLPVECSERSQLLVPAGRLEGVPHYAALGLISKADRSIRLGYVPEQLGVHLTERFCSLSCISSGKDQKFLQECLKPQDGRRDSAWAVTVG